jgi:CRP-like cAMP-binding protein
VVAFEAGQDVFREGDVGDAMYVIQEGEVELVAASAPPGLPRILLGPGEFFGESSVLEGRPRGATARAVSDCRLLKIDGHTLDALVRLHPEIGLHMIRRLSRRLTAAYASASALAASRPEPEAPSPGTSPAPAPAAPRLVHLSGVTFPLAAGGEVIIGRADPTSRFAPQIDLNPLLSSDAPRSVSRRHAVIAVDGTRVVIKELPKVANGTWLNERKLVAGVAEPLTDGDVISFGPAVKMTFRA